MIPRMVTLGIPTRNRAEFVLRAVRSALAQTCGEIEVIVSDNASTDDTVARLREIHDQRLTILEQAENLGMVGNFNACLNAARGEYFLMLSDDDVLEPEAIEWLRAPFLPESAAVGVTWCPCVVANAAGEDLWTTGAGPALEPSLEMVMGLFNGTRGPRFCSVMVRTADARTAGGYNEERHGAICDCGNWIRVAARYDCVACIPRPLARYTIHGGSVTMGSSIANWQRCGQNIYEDLVATLRASGKPVPASLRSASRNHVSNITVTVLLQTVGRPGWVGAAVREFVRSRRYMLTWFVAKRMLRDGWKLLSLGKRPSRLVGRIAAQFPPGQFARYLLVGVWNTLFGYATYAALTAALAPYIAQSYLPALVLSSFVNITNAFLAYKWFVFRTKGGYLREWSRCLAVYGSSTALSLFLLPAVVAVLRYGAGMRQSAPYVAGALLTGFGVIYNFVGHRNFSFRTRLADRTVS